MFRKELLLAFALFFCLPFVAQMKEKVKVILKNGSEFSGEKIADGEWMKVKTRDGNIFAFSKDEIASVVDKPSLDQRSGLYHHINFGTLSEENQLNLSFNIVTGYQVKSKLFAGLGLGVERLYNDSYVPVTMQIQYHPWSSWRSQPYIVANGGRLLLHQYEKGGNTYGFAIGMSQYLGEKASLTTSIGYQHTNIQKQQYCYYCYGPQDEKAYREFDINRLVFTIGVLIK